MQDACSSCFVDARDLLSLPGEGGFVDPPGDRQPFRVVGDRDILMSERGCRARHVLDRHGPIAVCRVHLKVGANGCSCIRMVGKDAPSMRQRGEPRADRGRVDRLGRLVEQPADDPSQPRTDAAKLLEVLDRLGLDWPGQRCARGPPQSLGLARLFLEL